MADDWQVGDMALCVNAGILQHNTGHGTDLRSGAVYRVLYVRRPGLWDATDLLLEGVPVDPLDLAEGYKRASRFRKIRPHAPDAEDAETIRLLTGAPVREPAA